MTAACATCGAPLPPDANYCPRCGRLVATAGTRPAKSSMPAWIIVVIVVGVLLFVVLPFFGIFAAILIPNFLMARGDAQIAADQNNLKQIATALESYAVDHGGRYPAHLPQLVPLYVKQLPTVPGSDGAYDYHHPAAPPSTAPYEIWDDGSMEPLAFGGIHRGDPSGPLCHETCKYVVYRAGVGIVGMPGAETNSQ